MSLSQLLLQQERGLPEQGVLFLLVKVYIFVC